MAKTGKSGCILRRITELIGEPHQTRLVRQTQIEFFIEFFGVEDAGWLTQGQNNGQPGDLWQSQA